MTVPSALTTRSNNPTAPCSAPSSAPPDFRSLATVRHRVHRRPHRTQPGEWFGPVKSGYGVHLVKILERKDGHLPELETIREDVLNDYRYDQREKLNESMLEALLEQYDVVIDDRPKPSKPRTTASPRRCTGRAACPPAMRGP